MVTVPTGEHAGRGRDPQRGGQRLVRALVHGRVGEDDAGQQVRVVQRPAEADDAAPVVPDGDHGAGQAEVVGQRTEVGDAVGQPVLLAGALGEPHLQLVDGDDPPRPLRAGAGRDEPAPEVTTRSGCRARTAGCPRARRRARARCRAGARTDRPSLDDAATSAGRGRPAARTSAGGVRGCGSPDDLDHGGVQTRADAHAAAPGRRCAGSRPAPRASSGARPGRRCPSAGTSSAPCPGRGRAPRGSTRVCTEETWCVTMRSTSCQSQSGCASFHASTTSSRPPASSPAGSVFMPVDAADAQLVVLGRRSAPRRR